ncbi:serpin family protein [Bradyrhizobium cenepequi]
MRSIFRVVTLVGLVGALHAGSAIADRGQSRVQAPAGALRFAQAAPSPVQPGKPEAAYEGEAASDRCGAPHAFETRTISAEGARARATFALDILTGLSSKSPNVSISPFGLSAVLSTLDLGADAAMKKAIAATLKLGPGAGKIEALRRESRLINLASERDPRRFASFNGIFTDHRLTLKPGVADLAKADGEVDLLAIDFGSQKGIDSVNELLAKKTSGRIKSILEPGQAPLLVVANAFVFKDCWKTPFDKAKTANKAFARADGSKSEPLTMSLVSDSIAYRASGRFVAVELPYKDEDFALTLVTTQKEPAKIEGFREASTLMTGTDFSEANVTLSLPKFGGAADNDLLEVLSAMGLRSGLASSNQLPGFGDGLVLGRVRQKTWLKVDETGTEAAAVTAAEATRSADAAKAVSVNFDKPFVYALRYRPTGTILIAGYVGDPGWEPRRRD